MIGERSRLPYGSLRDLRHCDLSHSPPTHLNQNTLRPANHHNHGKICGSTDRADTSYNHSHSQISRQNASCTRQSQIVQHDHSGTLQTHRAGSERDPSTRGDFTRKHGKLFWDTARLHHLTSVLKNPAISHKSLIECLDLELDSDTFHGSFERSDIMRYLPSLKSLCLSSKRPAGESDPDPYPVSPFVIGKRLWDVRKTLERLAIDIDQDTDFRGGSGIGTLRYFIALKHLSIQSHILLGERGDHLKNSQIENDRVVLDRTMLAGILPPGLQELQINCLTLGEGEYKCDWTQVITILLEDLMKWGLETLPELRDIRVYYLAKDRSSYFNDDDTMEVERDLKSKCKMYAFKGLWAEVERVLMEIATTRTPKRSVAVRYEQGTENGPRGSNM